MDFTYRMVSNAETMLVYMGERGWESRPSLVTKMEFKPPPTPPLLPPPTLVFRPAMIFIIIALSNLLIL